MHLTKRLIFRLLLIVLFIPFLVVFFCYVVHDAVELRAPLKAIAEAGTTVGEYWDMFKRGFL